MINKLQLLKTGYFIDNKYLTEYINLINSHYINNCYQEKHHIINEAYFKKLKIPTDNSVNNLVWLSYKDHCKAHYLLYFCTKGFLKKVNEFAFIGMIKPIKNYGKQLNQYKIETDILTEADLDELQHYMENIINDDNSQFWTIAELETLIKYYPNEGYNVYKRFPNRSPGTVKQKAISLGLRVISHYWTEEQINILVENYPKKSINKLSILVNKSYAGVKKKLVILRKRGLIKEDAKRRKN